MFSKEQERALISIVSRLTKQEFEQILGSMYGKEAIAYVLKNYEDYFRKSPE